MVRSQVDTTAYGRPSLRQHELRLVYEALTGEDALSDWSAGKVRYKVLVAAHRKTGDRLERETFDALQPCTKDELTTIMEALTDADDDSTAEKQTLTEGGGPGA